MGVSGTPCHSVHRATVPLKLCQQLPRLPVVQVHLQVCTRRELGGGLRKVPLPLCCKTTGVLGGAVRTRLHMEPTMHSSLPVSTKRSSRPPRTLRTTNRLWRSWGDLQLGEGGIMAEGGWHPASGGAPHTLPSHPHPVVAQLQEIQAGKPTQRACRQERTHTKSMQAGKNTHKEHALCGSPCTAHLYVATGSADGSMAVPPPRSHR